MSRDRRVDLGPSDAGLLNYDKTEEWDGQAWIPYTPERVPTEPLDCVECGTAHLSCNIKCRSGICRHRCLRCNCAFYGQHGKTFLSRDAVPVKETLTKETIAKAFEDAVSEGRNAGHIGPGPVTPPSVADAHGHPGHVWDRLTSEWVPHDPINPNHYKTHPSGVECITVTEHMSFNVGSAIKYLWRAGIKSPDVIQDLKKALWYIDREIKRRG